MLSSVEKVRLRCMREFLNVGFGVPAVPGRAGIHENARLHGQQDSMDLRPA
ncbi:hypothetical protein D9X30_5868 [Cupriavidus sp. U2]|nr:hypothetical protein D9X30_5868 [Cupriavidus sp. U2]